MPAIARTPPRLRAFAWLLAGLVAAMATLYGGLRFKVELGYSPLHYVVEDALVLVVGVLGILAAAARYRRARADALADEAAVAIAASLDRLPPGVDRFEVRMRPVRVAGIALVALLLVALGAGLGAMAWSRPSIGPAAWALALLGIGGLLLWLAFRQAPWGRPNLVLDAEGITHWLRGSVRWADVIGLRLHWTVVPRAGRIPMLFLGLARGVPVPGGWRRPTPEGAGVWAVNLRGLDQLPERIEAAALEFRDRVLPPRLAAWHQALRPGLLDALQEGNALMARFEQLEAAGALTTEAGQAEFADLARQAEANSRRVLAETRVAQASTRRSLFLAFALLGLSMLLGLATVVFRFLP